MLIFFTVYSLRISGQWSYLTDLISSSDKVMSFAEKGEAENIVYLDFSKGFDTISHSILQKELTAHGLDVLLAG